LATGALNVIRTGNVRNKKWSPGASTFFELRSAFGAFAAFAGTRFTVFMMLGAAFAAIVLTVARDRMIA